MRAIHSLPGGIHPAEKKTPSLGRKIRFAGIPTKLVIPLSQHIGAPAEPVVVVGQRVLKGQLIAEACGFVSAPCHAPSSGEISAIGVHPLPHPSGMEGKCITISTDGQDEWIEHQGVADYTRLEKSELLQIIRRAGITGMGGAGFPASVKLATNKPIETLIINATECEPYITADDSLMRERAQDIVTGVKVLRHVVSPGETVIGIEDNKPKAIAIMREAVAGTDIEVASFPTKYPSGGEKQLIQILTGKEVPSGGLPADIGVVMQNVGTAHAVYRAVIRGEPLLSRITTVTGNGVREQGNFEVLLGTPVQYLLDLCGLDQGRASQLIMGGPMMGFALSNTGVPVIKASNCILVPASDELPQQSPPQACIRCGMCAEACPVSLLPQQLYWFAQGKEYDKLEQHHLFDCIECGCCSYVCPSNIPLVQYYRASKVSINTQKREAIKSEQAKSRFEVRQQRIEREHAEKEARRKARSSRSAAPARQSDADNTSREAVVQAAIARSTAKKVTADPAQAAIERALSSRKGESVTQDPQAKMAKLEQRLASAEEKYQQVKSQGGDNLEAFANSVTSLKQKLQNARQVLASPEDQGAPVKAAATAIIDPAQAAINRAMSARVGSACPPGPQEKIARLQQRLDKARANYDKARAENNDKLAAFATAVDKLERQLEEQQEKARDQDGS